MTYRIVFLISVCCLYLSACHLNLNSHGDDGDYNGNNGADTTAVFYNASATHLPDGLSNTTQKVCVSDINQDGYPDLVLAVQAKPNKILINDGSGRFSDASSARLPSHNYDSRDCAIADYNGDGYMDLLFAGTQNNSDELFINNGKGFFSDYSNRIPVGGSSFSAIAADFNADGPIDILLGNTGQNTMLINKGNATFTNETPLRIPSISNPTRDLAAADLTGDDRIDILAANENENRFLANKGSGYFVDQTQSRIPLIQAEETRDIDLADVDSDGDLDIYFGNSGLNEGSNSQDRLLINNGRGSFSDQTTDDRLPKLTTDTFDADFADLDNDGDQDIIVGNYQGGVQVLENNGRGYFSDQSSKWIPGNFFPKITDLQIADFNGDGLSDVYLAVNQGSDQLLLQKNP